jgi:hypothetical protein
MTKLNIPLYILK